MEYQSEYDAFVLKDQCDDSLYESIHASLSFPLSSHEAPFNVSSSSSLDLKPLLNMLKYAFLGPNKTFPVIRATDLNSDQESQVLDLLRENKEALG